MKVDVIGGSIAGLSAAVTLTRGGADVNVFERASFDAVDLGARLGVDLALARRVLGQGVREPATTTATRRVLWRRAQWLSNLFRRHAALEGTRGSELDPRVHVAADAVRIAKRQDDAFSNPELDDFLKARSARRIMIVGVFAQACVRTTARAGLRAGYQVTVVSDGVGAGSERTRARALEKVKSYGAIVEPSASLANRLLTPQDDRG